MTATVENALAELLELTAEDVESKLLAESIELDSESAIAGLSSAELTSSKLEAASPIREPSAASTSPKMETVSALELSAALMDEILIKHSNKHKQNKNLPSLIITFSFH